MASTFTNFAGGQWGNPSFYSTVSSTVAAGGVAFSQLTSALFQLSTDGKFNILSDGTSFYFQYNGSNVFIVDDTGAGYLANSLHVQNGLQAQGVTCLNNTSFAFYGGPTISSGSGSPAGVVTAPVGSLYLRTDGGAGTTLYVKESGTGNTGWTAK